MNKDWKKWNYKDEMSFSFSTKNIKVFSTKLKISIFIFIVLFFSLINIKILEVLSLADGKVIPQGRIKFVQHLEGGIVEKILISEGDNVKMNQPLITLSQAKASSEYEEINTRLKSVELSILRINAEKNYLNEIPKDKIQQFDLNRVRSENQFLMSRKKKIESEESTMKKNILNIQKRYDLTKEQTKISEELLKVKATNRFKHLELLRELSSLEGQLDEQKNKLQTLSLNFVEQLDSEMNELKKEKSELLKRITKYTDSLDRTTLKSPVNGVVKLISVNSKGAIVAPGVTVVEIVPENEKLIIEAQLPLSEIGFIKNGLDCIIRLKSSDGSRFKPINGKVVFVGADRISNQNNDGFYLVKIETKESSFLKGNQSFNLYSGVPVTAGIITGKRSFVDYFFSPFRKNINFALSER